MSIKYKGKTISGPPGTDGKSAYEYAVEGGYTGTEDEFKTLIASGPWLPTSGGFVNGILSVKGDEFRLLSSGDNVPPLVFDFKPDENGKLIFDIYQFLYGGDIMLRGLESPLYDDAAANKKYVDDAVQAVKSGEKISVDVQLTTAEGQPVDIEIPDPLKGKAVFIEFWEGRSGEDIIHYQIYNVPYPGTYSTSIYSVGGTSFQRNEDTICWRDGQLPDGIYSEDYIRFTEM